MKQNTLALFIFRRDLRLQDNTALQQALVSSEQVIPCFIFDPVQIGEKNTYKSNNCIQFMLESLNDLAKELKRKNGHLYIFYGNTHAIVTKLLTKFPIDALFINYDYTPFSIERDKKLSRLCEQRKVKFNVAHDALLHAPGKVCKTNGNPYTTFTPFFKKARTIPVEKISHVHTKNYYTHKLIQEWNPEKISQYYNKKLAISGGRKRGLGILKKIAQFSDYNKTHDIPALPTTHLSPHNKFGTISIRETYHAIYEKLGAQHPLIRQLYWRDFFTQIAFHFPHVFGSSFYKKYEALAWKNSPAMFERWCTGTTGFPIIDAGMRELNTTGFMHNRVRMITASFLIKDLHIDWRLGEQYFAKKLVDYDPAVNNGNWQWVASTGCDAQPYFRIFNPWLQQKRFDSQCKYIKKWIPELAHLPTKTLHTWYTAWESNKKTGYPAPIINHKREALLAKKYYRSVNISRLKSRSFFSRD